jgi:hypothetical protein
VSELMDVADDFEERAETAGLATCQAHPETSLTESKCVLTRLDSTRLDSTRLYLSRPDLT